MSYRGPDVRTNVHQLNGKPTRQSIARHHSRYDGKRNLYDALGYLETSEIDFGHHWTRYQRQGTATALIDRFVESTWQSLPEIVDTADAEETEFEEQVEELFSGEALQNGIDGYLRQGVSEALRLTDTFATLGQFAVLFLGFADGEELNQPVEEDQFDGLDGLAYLTAVREDNVSVELVDDRSDPRHGLPDEYEIEFENSVETVHHSRVIHVVEGTQTSPLKGERKLLRGWNRFDDLEKIHGGSAEMAWRGAYPGMVLTPPTDENGVPMKFDDDGEGFEEEAEKQRHGMKRTMRAVGNLEVLSPSIADLSPHAEMQFRALAATYDIPLSIYQGNETGERATTEDRNQWSETIASRRNSYAEMNEARPFIDRLRHTGVLPDPEGGDYDCRWKPLGELSEQEWADLLKTKSQALDNLSGGEPDQLLSIEERRQWLDMPTERGSAVTNSQDGLVDPALFFPDSNS